MLSKIQPILPILVIPKIAANAQRAYGDQQNTKEKAIKDTFKISMFYFISMSCILPSWKPLRVSSLQYFSLVRKICIECSEGRKDLWEKWKEFNNIWTWQNQKVWVCSLHRLETVENYWRHDQFMLLSSLKGRKFLWLPFSQQWSILFHTQQLDSAEERTRGWRGTGYNQMHLESSRLAHSWREKWETIKWS